MRKTLKYSVLRYSPAKISGEFINLGILFSEESVNFHAFYYSKNIARIAKFDDMLDPKVLREFLSGIMQDIEGFSTELFFDIDYYVKFYINDYEFEKPKIIEYDDLDEIVDALKKTYFRFDYPKNERPTKFEDQRILADLIMASGTDFSRNKAVQGKYSESIHYDLVTADYYVKLFDFDGKDLKRCINTAKTWAWNSNYDDGKKVYIFYRYSQKKPEDSKEFKIISDIFNDSRADFFSIEESADVLQGAG